MKKYGILLVLVMALLAAGCKGGEVSVTATVTTGTVTEGLESAAPETTVPEAALLEDYMASVKERADAIRAALQQEPLTQAEMNARTQELYTLWDTALNELWGKIKETLPEEDYAKLLEEQRVWVAEKEQAMEAAGKEVENGSMYPLIVYGEAARMTEERVYVLYALLTSK